MHYSFILSPTAPSHTTIAIHITLYFLSPFLEGLLSCMHDIFNNTHSDTLPHTDSPLSLFISLCISLLSPCLSCCYLLVYLIVYLIVYFVRCLRMPLATRLVRP